MTWATPFGSEVAQVRSPGSLHNRWCCDPELKPPIQNAPRSLLRGGPQQRCESELNSPSLINIHNRNATASGQSRNM
ncbi:hypothetical protein EBA21_22500 [Xanthomonas oryzae pv. oryzae]|nr:hypothetical protein EBA18_22365 [Xanthomonas oryzae pv. oryzae]QBO03960.1 hypothetical protein EBA21_22500 [Xanthomonas oryzae pv. oryzae]